MMDKILLHFVLLLTIANKVSAFGAPGLGQDCRYDFLSYDKCANRESILIGDLMDDIKTVDECGQKCEDTMGCVAFELGSNSHRHRDCVVFDKGTIEPENSFCEADRVKPYCALFRDDCDEMTTLKFRAQYNLTCFAI